MPYSMAAARTQFGYIALLLVALLTVVLLLPSSDGLYSNPAQIPLSGQSTATTTNMSAASLNSSVAGWYPPNSTWMTDLDDVINGTGVHGFIFNGSQLPPGTPYGTYNWCNMPHVRASEYPRVSHEYELRYVEVVSRFNLVFSQSHSILHSRCLPLGLPLQKDNTSNSRRIHPYHATLL